MEIVLFMPDEVARELQQERQILIPPTVRSPIGDLAVTTAQVIGVAASVIGLAQGPQIIGPFLRALSRWVRRTGQTCSLEVNGPNGKIKIEVKDPDQFDLETAQRALATAWGVQSPQAS